ncbi:hypothetical protein NHP190003_16340 (plasmid) [Helicobacter sp. NHP19-003]|uniref:beta-lactamase n=1 Tax=Helicobacter gastrocanis TaxID=2849641 RepID=A0ABN6I5T1_9HELI|nr:tetratricopeptide repeat protein [Helicobacter sp. NHP19-003]BCZ18352.1 hypothetical protein NHP190003_16340 [Helicobacter sp. NHP19-003]
MITLKSALNTIFIGVLCLGCAKSDRYYIDARKALDEGNCKKASKFYQKLLKREDSRGYNGIGVLQACHQDFRALQNFQKAREAREKGNAKPYYNSGFFYYNISNRQCQTARDFFSRAGDMGYSDGYFSLGNLYNSGCDNIHKDQATAKKYWEKAANLGNAKALVNLGVMYKRNGKYKQAQQNFKKAGDMGESYGYLSLADMYLDPDPNLDPDLKDGYIRKALLYLQKAANMGDVQACISKVTLIYTSNNTKAHSINLSICTQPKNHTKKIKCKKPRSYLDFSNRYINSQGFQENSSEGRKYQKSVGTTCNCSCAGYAY